MNNRLTVAALGIVLTILAALLLVVDGLDSHVEKRALERLREIRFSGDCPDPGKWWHKGGDGAWREMERGR